MTDPSHQLIIIIFQISAVLQWFGVGFS